MAENLCRINLSLSDSNKLFHDFFMNNLLMMKDLLLTQDDTVNDKLKDVILKFVKNLSEKYNIDDKSISRIVRLVRSHPTFSRVNFWNKNKISEESVKEIIIDSIELITTLDKVEGDEELETGKIKSDEKFKFVSKRLNVLFGNQFALVSYFKKMFMADMRNELIFSRNTGPVSRLAVGKKIYLYKNSKYRTLRKFLLSDPTYSNSVTETTPEHMYNPSTGELNSNWVNLLLIAQKKFFGEDFIKLKLEDLIQRIIKYNNDTLINKFQNRRSGDNKLELDAYLSFVMFNPRIFDILLKSVLGDNIDIKGLYLGETNFTNNKYELKDSAKLETGWSDEEENKEALTKVSEILNVLIDGTPLRSIRSKHILQGRYLTKQTFLKFFLDAKVRALNIGDTTIIDAFNNFRDNPLNNMLTIVKHIVNSTNYNSNLRNIALTIWEEFLNPDDKSLFAYTLLDFKAVTNTYTLMDALAGMVDRMVETNYLYYTENFDLDFINSDIIAAGSGGRIKGLLIKKLNINVNRERGKLISDNKVKIYDRYGNVSFLLKLSDNETYTIIHSGNSRTLQITNSKGDNVIFSDLFSSELNSEDLYAFLLSGKDLNEIAATDKKNSIILLKFIDKVLGTRFTDGEGDMFSYFADMCDGASESSISGLQQLLKLLNDALSVIAIKLEYRTSDKTLEDFLSEKKYLLNVDEKRLKDDYVDYVNRDLLINRNNSKILERLTLARLLVSGDYYNSMVKGVNGNNVAKFKKTTLAQSIANVINKLSKYTVYSESILSKNPNLIENIVVLNGLKVRGENKLAKEFRPSEWYHSAFMYDYLGSMYVGEKGSYICMPVVYSDKTTFFKYQIGLNFKVHFNGDTLDVDLRKSSLDTLLKAIYLNRSQLYQLIYNRVNEKTSIILEENINRLKDLLKAWEAGDPTVVEPEIAYLHRLIQNSNIDENTKNRVNTVYQALISEESIDYKDFDTQRALMHLISLLNYNNLAFNKEIDASEYLYYLLRSLKTKDNGEDKSMKILDLNVSLHYLANKMYNAEDSDSEISSSFEEWFLTQQKRSIESMLKYGNYFKVTKTKSDNNEDITSGDAKLFDFAFKEIGIDFSDWLYNNRLIFAKVIKNGITYNILNYSQINLLENADSIEYNPLISRFLATDMLTSFDLRYALVGTELLHPNKNSDEKPRELLYLNYDGSEDNLWDVMKDVNQSELSSAKRTVNIGATISLYLRANILGIPMKQRRAIFFDYKGPVFGPNGKDKAIDAHDGGSKGSPLEMRLRNYSLLDERIKGTISKSIEISYTESGAQILDKYALHGMTNQEIRESLGSEMNLLNLVRRMHGIRFFKLTETGKWIYNQYDELDAVPRNVNLDINLTVDYLGNKISLLEITQNKAFYYDPDLDKYFLLVELTKVDGNDPTAYELSVYEVDKYGDRNTDDIRLKKIPKRINTIFDLWTTLGGCYSMTLENNKLVYSDTSWDILAIYVNSVGLYYGRKDEDGALIDMPNLYNTWLPLKNKFIGALDVKSAVKCGSYCINPTNKYLALLQKEGESNELYEARLESDLMYDVLDTTFSGELLDATHLIADGGIDVTQPTQVMAALENGGYSHDIVKEVYRGLAQQVLYERRELIESIDNIIQELLNKSEYVELDTSKMKELKSQIYEVLIEIGLKAAKHDDHGTLKASIDRIQKEVIAKHVAKHDTDPIYLPFSDSTLFFKLVSDYTSSINKKAIKHRSAGFAGVISPSYKMILLYRLPNDSGTFTTFTYSEIEHLAILYFKNDSEKNVLPAKLKVKLYLDNLLNKLKHRSISLVLPGLNIIVCDNLGNPISNPDGSFVRFNTEDWDQYKKLKDIYDPKEFTFKIDLHRPSDLLPMEVYWLDSKLIYSFYDIPIIRTIFDIRDKNKNLTLRQNLILDEYVLTILNILHSKKYVPITLFDDSEVEVINHGLSYKLNNLTEEDNAFLELVGLPKTIACRNRADNEKIVIHDAELIAPNQYAERLGVSYSTSLNEIVSQGPKFFEKQYKIKHKIPDKTAYNIALRRDSGKHLYFVLRDSFLEKKYFVSDIDFDGYKKVKDEYIRIDEDGNHLYVAGTFDKDGKLTMNIEEHICENGETVLVVSKPLDINLFLKEEDYDDVYINTLTDASTALKFRDVIVKQNPEYKLIFDPVTKVNNAIRKFITNEISEEKLKSILTFEDFNKNKIIQSRLLNNLEEFITNINNIKKDKRLSKDTRNSRLSLLLQRFLTSVYTEYNDKLLVPKIKYAARMKYAAFEKSRNYVAARIPAQTQLSFMKMRVVAFVNSNLNNIYVSRYQTWLQGSDYDIDKAYLIGHELSESGKYLAHSPLAVLDSIEGINLSEKIPIPNADVVFELDDSGTNINIELSKLTLDKYGIIERNISNLKILIDILEKVKDGKISFSNDYEKAGNDLIKKLNNHNLYLVKKNNTTVTKILNNVSLSGIERVISSILNYRLSHTPITIDSPRIAADRSELGREAIDTTLSNPFDRFLLTVQNMTGRDVIGIAAIGEKVFFGITHIINEALRSDNISDFKDILFKFDFISKVNKDGIIKTIEAHKHIIANINFENFQDKQKEILGIIRQYIENPDYDLQLALIDEFELLSDLALVISLLLSAATDNAKELILEKINGGSLTAGLYLLLIMLGMPFEQVAEYMTGPLVSSINNLAERLINSFSSNTSRSRNLIKNQANLLLGEIKVLRFLDWDTCTMLANSLMPNSKEKPDKALEDFIKLQISSDNEVSLDPKKDYSYLPNIAELQEYLNEVALMRKNLKKFYGDRLNDEIKLFVYLIDSAGETTLMGKIFSSNQGMPTNTTELVSWIQNVNDYVNNASYRLKDRIANLDDDGNWVVIENPESYYTKSEILKILDDAKNLGIIGDFDLIKFVFGTEEYKNAAIKYCSLIKYIHNIPYNIEHMSTLSANVKQYCAANLSFRINIATYRLTEKVIKGMKARNMYVDVTKRSIIEQLMTGLLIRHWLNSPMVNYNINLQEGDIMFNVRGERVPVKEGDVGVIDFKSPLSIATFKYFMELVLFNELKNKEELSNNAFVKNLSIDNGQLDKVTRDRIDTLIISDLDMMGEFGEVELAMYDNIVSDFAKLQTLTLLDLGLNGNISVVDCIALYNLIVNKNLLGSTRLTKLILDASNLYGLNLPSMNSWFNYVGRDLDYHETDKLLETKVEIEDFLDNLTYYLATPKSRNITMEWIHSLKRYSVKYRYKNLEGKTKYINFALELGVSKDMSNYFVLDNPVTRLKTDLYDLTSFNIQDSVDILARYIRNNLLNITFYCE